MSHLNEEMIIISDYKENKESRDRFNKLASLVFGIEFEHWYQRGCWDDRYICHSVAADHEIIANVSVSKMDLTINGTARKAIQIGTVMTHPDHRGKGLSSLLMNRVLDLYKDECDLFFLFANSSVHEYYPKFGFRPVTESRFTMESVESLPRSTAAAKLSNIRKLDCENESDFELMQQMARDRHPVSETFGVSHNNRGIFLFYAISVFPDCIYYCADEDAIVVCQQEGHTLHLYDVMSRKKVDLGALISRIANEQTRSVQFHFTTDACSGHVMIEPMPAHEDLLFVKTKDDLDLAFDFCVPKLAHA
ncbi:GNAT family N-acetyltransferase [Paenibacillus kobensis]|uniref:GNAT family N-acetyltransferase n=1 Tax=Paenibacillus kobensis TaxID=59841 RepID=UPI000FD97D85|nr:GNAT family N-acetyltransferase [Paenibacillus kobensis]